MTQLKYAIVYIIAAGCTLLTASCRNQANMYSTSKRIPLIGQPGSVDAQDVNGDGNTDIIVTDEEMGTVHILLGNGKGEFSHAEDSPFPAGEHPNDVSLGDFNGDQKMDMAIANHETDYITVLLGNGKGQFSNAPSSPIQVVSNPHPHGIASGDFNADGKLDLAIESWQDDEVLTMLGDGNGAFPNPHRRFSVGKVPYYKLQIADVNEDGKSDIITSNWGGSGVSILLANEAGEFLPANEIVTNPSPFAVAIGDINGDGHADLAIAHRKGNAKENDADGVSFLFGDGKGAFEFDPKLDLPSEKSPSSLASGDFNGDGIDDVAIANFASESVTVILGSTTVYKEAAGSPFAVGKGPSSVVLADVNTDGKADIIVANSESKDITLIFAPK